MPADPRCRDCEGTGWKQVVREGVEAVERCGCVRAVPAADLCERARIPARFENAAFENFQLPSENPIEYNNLSEAFVTAKGFVREYPFSPKLGLLFQGPSGTGKTHLAVAVLHELIGRGFECTFFDYQKWLGKIREGYDASAGPGSRQVYRDALYKEIVLLDDLGSARRSDWVEDTITEAINHRYNAKKALIATTNLPLPEFGDPTREKMPSGQYHLKDTLADRIGSRAVSRLFEMCRVIRMATSDYRLKDLRRGAGAAS